MDLPSAIDIATDPHICGQCGLEGLTCCTLKPGSEEYCFPVSEMEWDRILDFSPDRGVFVQEPNSFNFLSNMAKLFPGEEELLHRLFPNRENKFHLRLATRPDGACIFLDQGGCKLPREARPYYCRLFPFWRIGKRLTMFCPPNCLAVSRGRTVPKVLDLLGVSEAEVQHLHGRLRLAWGLPPRRSMRLLKESFTRYDKEKR